MFLSLKRVICLASLISASVIAQEVGKMQETLPSGQIVSGGYGAPFTKMSRISDQDAVFTGAKGAWIINHQYSLGLAAYGLVNNISVPGYNDRLQYGVGGANLEYIYPLATDFSVAGSVLLGGGIVDFKDNTAGADGVYVAEPEIDFMYSVTKNFKVALNGSYRAVADSNLAGVSNNKLSGFTYGLALNFGSF